MMTLSEQDAIADEWFKALDKIPLDEQISWVQTTLEPKKMLHVFGRYFFMHIIKGNSTPDCHIDLIRELSNRKSSAIIFPRGFAKSTWTKIDTIHDIVYGLEPVILYVSDTAQSAGFHFESIKTELENNDHLRHVYGNLVPEMRFHKSVKWTNNHFETANGVNVVARGAGNGRGINIRNQRPTKIIIDDAETDEQVGSSVRRSKYHDWLHNVIMPSLDKERGRIKVIGTVIHEDCEVLNFYNEHGGILRKAIEDEKSIWSSYWTLADLDKKRDEMGTRAFMQEYMNEAMSLSLASIKSEWIDEQYFTVLPKDTSLPYNVLLTIDPQSGETSEADEYAITALAWYTGDTHRYVIEQICGRASQLQQAIVFIKTWLRYPDARICGIEKVLNQVTIYQLVKAWRDGTLELDGLAGITNHNIPVVAITPGGKDKITRFRNFEPMIERGELHIKPEMKKLREQMLFLGTGKLEHDDRVDSLTMALEQSYIYGHNGSDNRLQGLTQRQETTAGDLWKQTT